MASCVLSGIITMQDCIIRLWYGLTLQKLYLRLILWPISLKTVITFTRSTSKPRLHLKKAIKITSRENSFGISFLWFLFSFCPWRDIGREYSTSLKWFESEKPTNNLVKNLLWNTQKTVKWNTSEHSSKKITNCQLKLKQKDCTNKKIKI